MLLQVPVIAEVDLLIAGLTPQAVRLAVETRAAGKSVFAFSMYPFAGEGEAAHYDFSTGAAPEMDFFFPDGAPRTPTEFKLRLETVLVRRQIDFLYQAYPVARVNDAAGRFAGLLIADRSGFQIIAAKALFDATERSQAARVCGVPFLPFVPGVYRAERMLLGGAAAGAEPLPESIRIECRKYRKFRFAKELAVAGNSARDFARAETEMRLASWSPETVYASDESRIAWRDGVALSYTPSAELPVALPAHLAMLDKLLAREAGKPASIPGTPTARDYEAVRCDAPPRFGDCPTVPFELDRLPAAAEHCDVLVAGGGTGGAPAAIAAGEAGARTICVEGAPEPGGVTTVGRISNYCFGNIVGYTTRVDDGTRAMAEAAGETGLPPKRTWYNPVWRAHYYWKEMAAAGVDFRTRTLVIAALKQGDRVCGAIVAGPTGIGAITAETVIDATGNADLAAAAGARTSLAAPEEPAIQGAGLSPLIPGVHYTNTDFQFICDHDVADTTRAFVMGRGKFAAQFDLIQIPNTRERRRIVGDLVLQVEDFYTRRQYEDTINIARSNFDTHGFIIHPLFMIEPPGHEPRFANVPLRALLPVGLRNIAVTGLAVSAHRDCMPLIRMQPDVQNQGFAAGLAAAMALGCGGDYRRIDVRKLQQKLAACGILPESILAEHDGVPALSADETDPMVRLSALFQEPARHLPEVKRIFAETRQPREAEMLAFLGDAGGAEVLEAALDGAEWDKGWNFTGMGQFGLSSSPQDVMIFALNTLNRGRESVLRKLAALQPEADFSHFRAVCFYLEKHPCAQAAADLRRLLCAPGVGGFAVTSLDETRTANGYDVNETKYRNCQLKEFYLAKALSACAPGDPDAARTLDAYRNGLLGYFAMYA